MSQDARPEESAIFINYRSEDSGAVASALARDLRAVFGVSQVFIDHLEIRAGTAFPDALASALAAARVLLALIGTSWLTSHDEYGIRRIDRPDDWVRRELEHALSHSVTVIPLYVEGASRLPRAAFLTVPSLGPIAELQGLPLRRASWQYDLALIRARIIECGIAESRPVESAQRALAIANGLRDAVSKRSSDYRRTALERLAADLELIHKDYLTIFEGVLEQIPDSWEQGDRYFADRVRVIASLLQRLRIEYEPVRVRVRVTAESLADAVLPPPELEFVKDVLAYFPTGELRGSPPGSGVTSATALLEYLKRSPSGQGSQALREITMETLRRHREGWVAVCRSYGQVQLYWGE